MPLNSRLRQRGVALSAVCAMVALLNGCDLAKNQLEFDRSAELDRQDYRDALAPQPLPPETSSASSLDFQPVVTTPEELRLPSPLVTVSVNQTVSLRDLLFELADQADVDLELDPQIRGSVIFKAKERPFDEVVDRLCEMAGLRYTFEGHVLRVELDRPYIKTYRLDYVNMGREGESSMETSVSLGGGSGGGGGDSGGAGSSGASTAGGSEASIDSSFEGDVWQELEDNIEQILAATDTALTLATLADPVTQVSPPAFDPLAMGIPPSNSPPGIGDPLAGLDPAASAAMAAPPAAPVLNVAAVQGEPLVPNPPATYSLSRQSGTLSVFASARQQKEIEKFLKEFRSRITTQIAIEARVLQVDLSDEFATGIDWQALNLTGVINVDPSFGALGFPVAPTGSFTGVIQPGNDVNVAISAISRFGTVRTLSSPRVMVLNNQPALVNVTQNNVFFNVSIEVEEDADTGDRTVTPEVSQASVPEGVILSVLPTANPDTGEIMMSVRPTVSKITSTVTDPSIIISLIAAGADPADFSELPPNNVPELAVQEIDSLLRLQSGQTVVMGGLMKDANSVTEESVPVLGDIPFLGSMFRNHSDNVQKSELVIFLTARVVPGSGNADEMDRKIYKKFGYDRRPVRF